MNFQLIKFLRLFEFEIFFFTSYSLPISQAPLYGLLSALRLPLSLFFFLGNPSGFRNSNNPISEMKNGLEIRGVWSHMAALLKPRLINQTDMTYETK